MADLKSKKLIVLKGILFLAIILITSISIFLFCPRLEVALLIIVLIWASARFYYFLFYVLEKYVDPNQKYAGLWDMIKRMKKK